MKSTVLSPGAPLQPEEMLPTSPARLIGPGQRLALGYVGLFETTEVSRLPRPSGYDVSPEVYRARVSTDQGINQLGFRPLPTEDIPAGRPERLQTENVRHLVSVGLSTELIVDTLNLGVSGIISTEYFQTQRPFFVDERAQFYDNGLHFEFLGDRLEVTSISVGLAYHPWPQLSFGVGATMQNQSASRPQVYVPDAADQENVITIAQVEVKPTLAPHFGLVYRPMKDDRLELSGSIHLATESRLKGTSELRFWDYVYPEGQTELYQPLELTFLSEPLRIGLGANARLPLETPLQLYASVAWAEWSEYIDRLATTPSDWNDTVDVRGGARISLGRHAVGLGFGYFPTPVPSQSGRTNYVDNERLAGQVGWSVEWRGAESTLRVGIGAQLQRLLERAHAKQTNAPNPIVDEFPDSVDVGTGEPIASSRGLQTNNPGFPGFRHSGWLSSVFVNLQLEK